MRDSSKTNIKPLVRSIAIALAIAGSYAPRSAEAIQVLSLANIDGTNGFRLNGITERKFLGYPLSAIGDINGDGLDDVAIGAYFNGAGSGFVVFGRSAANPFPPTLALTQLDGSNGFRINGEASMDRTTYSIHAAGDVNGDGHADLVFGAPKADPNGSMDAGSAYVLFGRTAAQPFPSVIETSALQGTQGFRINGAAQGDNLGHGVTGVGDFNDDGVDDFAVAAILADPQSRTDAGAAYLIFGRTQGFADVIDVSTLNSTTGLILTGASNNDSTGRGMAGAGDINGDGLEDMIIGAFGADSGAGASFVVFGHSQAPMSGTLDLATIDGTNGFRLNAGALGGTSRNVAGRFDLNLDGHDDLAISAWLSPPMETGATAIIYGRASGAVFAAQSNLSDLDGNDGFILIGDAVDARFGYDVDGAGDVNGDGIDDLIVSAYQIGELRVEPARHYLIFGRPGAAPFDADTMINDLDNSTGYRFDLPDVSGGGGTAVSRAGDINDDGFDDLMIAAWLSTPEGGNEGAGSVFIVYGGDPMPIYRDIFADGME